MERCWCWIMSYNVQREMSSREFSWTLELWWKCYEMFERPGVPLNNGIIIKRGDGYSK